MITVDFGSHIERDDLPRLQNPTAGDSVDHFIVNAHADRPGITVCQDRARLSPACGEHITRELIELAGRHARSYGFAKGSQRRTLRDWGWVLLSTDNVCVTLVEVYSDVSVVRWQRPIDREFRLDRPESIKMMRSDFDRPGLIRLFTEDGEDCGPPGGGGHGEHGLSCFVIDAARLGDRPTVTLEGEPVAVTALMALPWLRLREARHPTTPCGMIELSGTLETGRCAVAVELYDDACRVRLRHRPPSEPSRPRDITARREALKISLASNRGLALTDDVSTSYRPTGRGSVGEWELVSYAPTLARAATEIHLTSGHSRVSATVPWRRTYIGGDG